MQLFLERGYEGASMDAIASAAGTTKASLYARFPSKEVLFSSVLEWAVRRSDWPLPEPDPPDLGDLEGALKAIASTAARRALHPSMINLGRIAIAQAARFPDIAHLTHSDAVWPRQQIVVDLLNLHAATGAIVLTDDAEILAEHFLGMVSAAPARLAAFGIVRDAAAQEHRTQIAVQLFARSLRPC